MSFGGRDLPGRAWLFAGVSRVQDDLQRVPQAVQVEMAAFAAARSGPGGATDSGTLALRMQHRVVSQLGPECDGNAIVPWVAAGRFVGLLPTEAAAEENGFLPERQGRLVTLVDNPSHRKGNEERRRVVRDLIESPQRGGEFSCSRSGFPTT